MTPNEELNATIEIVNDLRWRVSYGNITRDQVDDLLNTIVIDLKQLEKTISDDQT